MTTAPPPSCADLVTSFPSRTRKIVLEPPPLEDMPSERVARFVPGGSFALDVPLLPESLWGKGLDCLMARGEPTMIFGPQGLGKTTLAQRIVRATLGLDAGATLDFPVAQIKGRVLYLAMDRPRQAARSLRRMTAEPDRGLLDDRLLVWLGPLPFSVAKEPERLAEFCAEHGAVFVVVDSMKDLAAPLSDDAIGAAINSALQHCMANGIDALSLHHPRKAQAENKKPRALDDVYGSTWLTAGCGSVLSLWGKPGDPVVELTHLKQPANEVGPLMLELDHPAGAIRVLSGSDPLEILRASMRGLTVREAAALFYGEPDPRRADEAKARRRLDGLVTSGLAHRVEPPASRGAIQGASRYVATTQSALL